MPLSLVTNAQAGGMVSGGAERPYPWFEGPSAVRYCIRGPVEMSETLRNFRNQISVGFARWTQRIRKVPARNLEARFGVVPAFSLRFEEVHCLQNPNLVFMLGSVPVEMASLMHLIPREYVSVNLKTGHDSAGRPRGIVWFPSDLGTRKYFNERGMGSFNWLAPGVFSETLNEELSWIFGFNSF